MSEQEKIQTADDRPQMANPIPEDDGMAEGHGISIPEACRELGDEAEFVHPADLADHLENLSLEKQVCALRHMPTEDAAEALAELAAPWRMEGYGKRGPGAKPRLLKSVYLAEGALAARNRLLMEKYAAMQAEACAECWNTDDAELVVVAFGSMARIARSAIRKLREEGLKAGLFRPKTLYPFPADAPRALAPGRRFLVIEQNTGQMVEDVRLSLMGENAKVDWHGVMPGLFIGADALEDPIRQACKEN